MAKLKYNSETPDNAAHELFEVEIGEKLWTDETPEEDDEPYVLLDDESEPHIVFLENADFLGLKPNTVYRLIEVPTTLEADAEIIMPDDEEPAEELN